MQRLWKGLKGWLPFAVLFAVLLFVKVNVGQAAYIPSGSMIPTLKIHDVLIIDKMVKPSGLRFGDIVVFHPPKDASAEKILIKRLIGLPGDIIEISGGRLLRNGEAVEESYIREAMDYQYGPVQVPEGEFLFLGDNRNESYDSHLWPTPFVPKESIIGRAVYRIFPFNHMQGIQ